MHKATRKQKKQPSYFQATSRHTITATTQQPSSTGCSHLTKTASMMTTSQQLWQTLTRSSETSPETSSLPSNMDFHTAVKHRHRASNLTDRVKRYLENRTDTEHRIESVDNTIVLEFETLDDARMFVLSFSDVIDTHGVRFD